ncbi:MAG: NDP-sugar synthase [Alloprevotella sp.]
MKFAIIAAGEGSRLQEEGIDAPKPLVEVKGEKLIERLIRIFRQNGAEEIVIIVNAHTPRTERFVKALKGNDLRVIVKSTPSSMHSFFELSAFLTDGPFCLTTVDTIFKEDEFAAFIEHFKQSEADGCMAVTDFIDDEKPLYVGVNADLRITGFLDERQDCRYVSGGIYCLKPAALETLRRCVESGQSRMRNYQRALIADGFRLEACPFSKILDIDHASDIAKAEEFLKDDKVS